MGNYRPSHKYLDDHPLFLNFSIINYDNDFVDHSLIGSGKIYLCFLYGDFGKINADGKVPELPLVQLQPVENHFKMSAAKGAKLINMGMRPQVWYNITRTSARDAGGAHFDLFDCLPQEKIMELYKSLEKVESNERGLEIVDEYLGEYYELWTRETPLDGIIEEIFERRGKLSIKEILDKYPVARSTLNAHFDKYVGLSPKFYTRLIHFNYILREYFIEQKSLAEIIRDWEYYDYSHFKKDMVLFTGMPPKEIEDYKSESLEGLFKNLSYW